MKDPFSEIDVFVRVRRFGARVAWHAWNHWRDRHVDGPATVLLAIQEARKKGSAARLAADYPVRLGSSDDLPALIRKTFPKTAVGGEERLTGIVYRIEEDRNVVVIDASTDTLKHSLVLRGLGDDVVEVIIDADAPPASVDPGLRAVLKSVVAQHDAGTFPCSAPLTAEQWTTRFQDAMAQGREDAKADLAARSAD